VYWRISLYALVLTGIGFWASGELIRQLKLIGAEVNPRVYILAMVTAWLLALVTGALELRGAWFRIHQDSPARLIPPLNLMLVCLAMLATFRSMSMSSIVSSMNMELSLFQKVLVPISHVGLFFHGGYEFIENFGVRGSFAPLLVLLILFVVANGAMLGLLHRRPDLARTTVTSLFLAFVSLQFLLILPLLHLFYILKDLT